MIIDTITPTFSYPSAANFYEISTDGGQTYTSASTLELNYYALDKMEEDFSELNPLRILFRKKENVEDEAGYLITKILVNEACTFLPSPNTGLNVQTVGVQEAGDYFAGRYATYNSVTTGGLNFQDFKLKSIKTSQTTKTEMQMIFFVRGKMKISIELPTLEWTDSVYKGSVIAGISVTKNKGSVDKNGKIFIDENTEQIVIYTSFNQSIFNTTKCWWNENGGEEGSSEEQYGGKVPVENNAGRILFKYALTSYNCFETSVEIPERSTTGEIEWIIPISEVVWVDDPKISFEVTAVQSFYRNRNWGFTDYYIWYGDWG